MYISRRQVASLSTSATHCKICICTQTHNAFNRLIRCRRRMYPYSCLLSCGRHHQPPQKKRLFPHILPGQYVGEKEQRHILPPTQHHKIITWKISRVIWYVQNNKFFDLQPKNLHIFGQTIVCLRFPILFLETSSCSQHRFVAHSSLDFWCVPELHSWRTTKIWCCNHKVARLRREHFFS